MMFDDESIYFIPSCDEIAYDIHFQPYTNHSVFLYLG